MPPIITSTEVERPAEDVFAYATDPTRFHEWQQGVVNGRMDQPGAPSIRARCQTTRRIGGANRASTCEVVRITPPTTWGVQDIDRPIRAIVDVTVEPSAAHRSRLSIAVISRAMASANCWCRSSCARGTQGDAGQPGGPEAAARAALATAR